MNSAFPGDPAWIEKLRTIHPFKLFIYIALISILILFAFLAVGFILTNDIKSFYLPKFFTLSTLFLMASSTTLIKAVQHYERDIPKLLNRYLVATFLLALLFISTQMLGWKEMFSKGIHFNGAVNGSYLLLLSGLHLLHFFGGMVFFLFIYFRAFNAYRDAVNNLVYITDPYEKMLLDLLSYYWHAMSGIWIALYLIFLCFTF